jgi:hypothetical protein
MTEPEMWGGELDPPRRVRWRRKAQGAAEQDDAVRSAASADESPAPRPEIRAARLAPELDAVARMAAGAVPQPLTPATVAGAGRRIAEARRGRRRDPGER